MHKRQCLLSLLFLFPISLFCQHTISGKIIDDQKIPVPFAIVALVQSNDSTIINGVISDANGQYIFENINSGNYFLKISVSGYADNYSEQFIKDSLNDLLINDIIIDRQKELDQVTVSSVTPTIEFKNGNIIVNVENSPLARGNSVYDLLFRLPGVSIVNNTITLQGKSGVIVMIDGRIQQLSNEQMLNRLKGMSAATIQKIEVLKNPPVKYDAAGTSGMINIITKKSEQRGFNGSIYTETSQGFYYNSSVGASLNYKNEKFSVFTSLDGVSNIYGITTETSRIVNSDSGQSLLGNRNAYKILEQGLTFKIGTDWYINKSNIIGIKIDGGPGIYDETGKGINNISEFNNTGFDHLLFSEDGHNKWNVTNYNLNAEHHFDTTGTVLSFSADYTSSKENDNSLYSNYFYDANDNEVASPSIFRNINQQFTQISSSKLDFIHPIDSVSTIECGVKGSNTNMTNDYLFENKDNSTNVFSSDSNLTNYYKYSENNFALYFNYSATFKYLNFQAGLRGENTFVNWGTQSNSVSYSKKYFSFFPNVSLEYSKSENHIFQINLNRRIDRPSFWGLNPFLVYYDIFSYSGGNPYLEPDYSNTAEITYSFKGIVTNSFSYSRINNFMLDVTEQFDSTKILYTTSKNIKFNDVWSYLLFIKYDFTNWYEITFNANASYLEYKGDIKGVPFHSKGFSYDANLSNTFLLPGKTKLEISAFYRGPNLFGPIQIDPLWSMSMAIQKSFLKDRLDCTIGIKDIFNTFKFHTYSTFDNQNWNFYQTSDSRRFSASISYNFGRTKSEEREMNSNEQEKERLGH
ncbi:outer membrane beta-barrel family protein [soil metagenome]